MSCEHASDPSVPCSFCAESRGEVAVKRVPNRRRVAKHVVRPRDFERPLADLVEAVREALLWRIERDRIRVIERLEDERARAELIAERLRRYRL